MVAPTTWSATGPQLVVRPNAAGTDISLSMLHAGAGSAGLEWIASPKVAFAVYYSADYYSRDFFSDTTNTAHPGTIIGYGGPWVSQYKQPEYPAGDLRLVADFLEKSQIWSAAVLHSVFVSDSCPLVCRSGRSQECASQHGLFRIPLRFAFHFRNAAAGALSKLGEACEDHGLTFSFAGSTCFDRKDEEATTQNGHNTTHHADRSVG